jgi:hypothetical protein
MKAAVVKPVFSIGLDYPGQGRTYRFFQGFMRVGLCGAQLGFELAKGYFNGIEVRRVGWQKQQAGPALLYQFRQPGRFMHRQVIQHRYVAGLQGWPQHLVKVGGEDRPINRSIYRHGCYQAVAV